MYVCVGGGRGSSQSTGAWSVMGIVCTVEECGLDTRIFAPSRDFLGRVRDWQSRRRLPVYLLSKFIF